MLQDSQTTRAENDAPAPAPRHQSLEMERTYLRALVGPEFRPVLGMVGITLSIGTIFYSVVEQWSLLDALYFSVVTLATIGFGDLAPVTRLGKIFTIFYVFVGVGTLGLFLSTVARSPTQRALRSQRKEGLARAIEALDNDDQSG